VKNLVKVFGVRRGVVPRMSGKAQWLGEEDVDPAVSDSQMGWKTT
jgi:hypothetical protein